MKNETGTFTDMHKLFTIYILLKRNVYIIVYILCHTICLQDKDDNNFLSIFVKYNTWYCQIYLSSCMT